MFENIMSKISNVVGSKSLGGTSYIDGLPFSQPVKGQDEKGRKFFAIPVEVTEVIVGKNWKEGESGKAVATFFQRYSDDQGFWVEVGSHQGHFSGQSPITHTSGFRAEELLWVEPILEKLLAGETVTFDVPKRVHGWDKVEKKVRMLRPEEFPQE